MLLCAWVSGALALAAREQATWLGASLVLAAAAVAFAAMPWFVSREPDANMNDVFDVRRVYASRISLIGWTAAISVVLFGVALIVGIAPVLATDTAPTASTSVSFETSASPVIATIEVDVTNAGSGEPFTMEVQSFASADGDGTVRAHLADLASEDGTAETVQQLGDADGRPVPHRRGRAAGGRAPDLHADDDADAGLHDRDDPGADRERIDEWLDEHLERERLGRHAAGHDCSLGRLNAVSAR